MEYLTLLFFFVPFLFLFSMAIEILLRDPRNLLHRITMVFFLSFGLLFLGDFIMQVFPLEKAGFGEKIKLTSASACRRAVAAHRDYCAFFPHAYI